MKFLILHLSDCHFGEKVVPAAERGKSVSAAIRNLDPSIKLVIVAITGDVAYSGQSTEYSRAKVFFDSLAEGLVSLPGKPAVHLVAIPGNHDCLIEKDDSVRSAVIDRVLQTETADDRIVESLTGAQASFFEFAAQLGEKSRLAINFGNKLAWTHTIVHDGHSFQLICFNTSWMSQVHEQQADIIFPIDKSKVEIAHADVNISLLHHPFNWLRSNNAKAFQRMVEKNSDVILSGHEHVSHSYTKKTMEKGHKEFFEGGVFFDSDVSDNSFFGVLFVDLENLKTKHLHFCFKNELYVVGQEGEWAPFLRSAELTKNQFEISPAFLTQLNSAGATYSHPRRDSLFLDDLFVYPDLQDPSVDPSDENQTDVIDAATLSESEVGTSFLILGEEQSGKSALARKLFLDFHRKGKVPLLIGGSKFKSQHLDWLKMVNLLKKEFKSQYGNTDWATFDQLASDEKVLIIDDFDSTPLNSAGKSKVISLLKHCFSTTVAFADELFEVEEIASADSSASALLDFRTFRLLEFGHAKREDLIEKWLALGQDFTENAVELEKKRAKVDQVLHAALVKRLIPSFPIFILICVQQIEHEQFNENAGSYGYLFHRLITDSLMKATFSNFATDTLQTYLSVLASEMSKSNLHEVNFAELTDFHEKHREEYGVTIPLNTIVDRLIAAGIFQKNGDAYRFKFKYFYLYFDARQMSRTMQAPEVTERISSMVKGIHLEDNANILMFLTYFLPDSSVTNTIVTEATSIFSSLQPCDFIQIAAGFNEIDVSAVSNYLDIPENARKARKDALKNQDARARRSDSADDLFEKLHEINRAAKAIQVLGQILRNYPGSMKREPKRRLVEECYGLGMRSLAHIFGLIKQHQNEVIDAMVLALNLDKKVDSRDDLQMAARRIFIAVNQSIARVFIHRVSRSIGNETLEMIYTDIRKADDSASTALIDFAIRLEHFGSFPEKDLRRLVDKYKDNRFIFGVIGLLVRHYIFLFPSDYATKQKIAAIFGYKVSRLRNKEILNKSRMLIETKREKPK